MYVMEWWKRNCVYREIFSYTDFVFLPFFRLDTYHFHLMSPLFKHIFCICAREKASFLSEISSFITLTWFLEYWFCRQDVIDLWIEYSCCIIKHNSSTCTVSESRASKLDTSLRVISGNVWVPGQGNWPLR